MATETLRPSANGGLNQHSVSSGNAFTAVSDNSDTTYIRNNTGTALEDRFDLPAPSVVTSGDTINQIDVRFRARTETSSGTAIITVGLRLGSTTSNASAQGSIGTSAADYSKTAIARPGGGSWTFADLADLQVVATSNDGTAGAVRIFELYVDVQYTVGGTPNTNVNPGVATGSGTAFGVTTAGSTSVDAGPATGTGTALSPTASSSDVGDVTAQVRARAEGSEGADTTSHDIVLPTALAGDQLYVGFSSDTGSATVTRSAQAIADGWTILGSQSQGVGTNNRLTIAHLASAVGGGADVLELITSTAEQSTHISASVIGGGTPTLAGEDTASSTTADVAPLTGLTDTDEYLSLIFCGTDSGATTAQAISVPPTGWTTTESINPSTTTSAATFLMERTVVMSGTTLTPGAATLAVAEQSVTWHIAIPPAPGGADTNVAAGHATGAGTAYGAVADDGSVARLPANPGEALWIGHGDGSNHFNIGIGVDGAAADGYQSGDTVHTSETSIGAGFELDPTPPSSAFRLLSNGDVEFRVTAGAGRTSTNTSHPRCELREFDENGNEAEWNGSSDKHHMWGRSRVTAVTNNRPWVCIFQIHDAASDLVRVQCQGSTGQTTGMDLVARWERPGESEVVTVLLDNTYDVGEWLDWEIMVGGDTGADDGRLRIWINGSLLFDEPDMGTTGCYFKAGNYLQSSALTQGEDPNDESAVEIAKGTFGHWHTGWATNSEPVYTGAIAAVDHHFYLTSTESVFVPGVRLARWEAVLPAALSTPRVLGNSAAGTALSASGTETAATQPYDVMLAQFVSGPASAAGTLTGDLELVFGRGEDDAAASLFTSLGVWVTQGDTGTLRGQAIGIPGAVEWPTTHRATRFAAPLNDVEFEAGDRIVVELGYQAQNTVTTPYTGTVYFGGTASPDLASQDTDFTHPSWINLQITEGVTFTPEVDTTNVDAGLATGSGAAGAPTMTGASTATAGLASGAGAALQPGTSAAPAAGLASGTGAAQQPAVSTDGAVSVSAGLAAGQGAAEQAATSVATTAGLAAGTGTAEVAHPGANAGVATGAGSALAPTAGLNAQPGAGLATGSGTAYNVASSDVDPIGTSFLRQQFPGLDAFVVVEAAWGADITADASTWTWSDITQDVRQADSKISITHGRADEASTSQPAECTLTLDNREGLYSLGGQSPNWPYIRRNTPIRAQVDPSTGGFTDLFVGYATSWSPDWDASGNNATVKLSAHGMLRRLEQRSSPVVSAIRQAYLHAEDVVAYWPCEDSKGSTSLASGLPGHRPMSITGDAEQPFPKFEANDDFVCSSPLPEVALTRWNGSVPAYTDTGEWQVRWLMSAPLDPMNGTSCVLVSVELTGSTLSRWEVEYHNQFGGSIQINLYDSAGTLVSEGGLITFRADNTTRRWSLEVEQDGDDVRWSIFSLGVGRRSASGLGNLQLDGHTAGRVSSVIVCPNVDFDDVAIGHVIVQSRITSNSTERAQFEAHNGEGATDRLSRLCAENDIPFTLVGETDVRMGPQPPADLVSLLRECEAVEQGLLVDGLHAGLTYISRSEREARTPDLVLDAAQGKPERQILPTDDDQRNLNLATVTRTAGLAATYEDVDGPMGTEAVGVYDDSSKINSYEDLDVIDHASWLVNLGTVEGYRHPSLGLNLARDPDLIPAWLATTLSSRIDVTNLSQVRSQYPAGDIPLLVEGYTQTISQMVWDVELNCSSYEPWRLGVLAEDTGDDGEYVLRADSDGATVAVLVAAGATTMQVTTPSGPRWTTDADDFPMQVSVGGIPITVTAISGTGTTQTFTVDPASVTKALPMGVSVGLWRPTRIGL